MGTFAGNIAGIFNMRKLIAPFIGIDRCGKQCCPSIRLVEINIRIVTLLLGFEDTGLLKLLHDL